MAHFFGARNAGGWLSCSGKLAMLSFVPATVARREPQAEIHQYTPQQFSPAASRPRPAPPPPPSGAGSSSHEPMPAASILNEADIRVESEDVAKVGLPFTDELRAMGFTGLAGSPYADLEA